MQTLPSNVIPFRAPQRPSSAPLQATALLACVIAPQSDRHLLRSLGATPFRSWLYLKGLEGQPVRVDAMASDLEVPTEELLRALAALEKARLILRQGHRRGL